MQMKQSMVQVTALLIPAINAPDSLKDRKVPEVSFFVQEEEKVKK